MLSGCVPSLDVRVRPETSLKPLLDFCAVYLPVYTDEKDTEETQKQIDKNNAVWMEKCETK